LYTSTTKGLLNPPTFGINFELVLESIVIGIGPSPVVVFSLEMQHNHNMKAIVSQNGTLYCVCYY